MSHALGIDLGTTNLTAASCVGAQAQPVALRGRELVVPALTAIVGPDPSSWLTGWDAADDGAIQPSSIARNVKRDIGRTVPMSFGGSPATPGQVMAHQLAWVYGRCTDQTADPPAHVTLTHPASWLDVQLEAFLSLTDGLDAARFGYLAEPDAAAIHFAATTGMPTGKSLVVFDLGGGTTDVSVLHKAAYRFELLGHAVGDSTLGGVDVTDALVAYTRSLRPSLDSLDLTVAEDRDRLSALVASVERAKRTLSVEQHTDVAEPGGDPSNPIRLTRGDFEDVAGPIIRRAVDLIPEACGVADVSQTDIHGVLLVGGGSRSPLVGAMVQERLHLLPLFAGDPKHCVSLGAALNAAAQAGLTQPVADRPAPSTGTIAVNFDATGITGSTDIPAEVATVSKLRQGSRHVAFRELPRDFVADDVGGGLEPAPPDRRLAMVAIVVVIVVVAMLVVLRLVG